jgi:hypothetical protein
MIKIDINKKLHGSSGEMDLAINLEIKENDMELSKLVKIYG